MSLETLDLGRRYRTDILIFLGVVLALTLVPFVALVIAPAGSPTGSPWFLVLTFAPTLAGALLWLVGRRRTRVDQLGRLRWGSWMLWLPAGIVLGAAPVILGVALDGALGGPSLDPGQPADRIATAGPLGATVMLLLGGPLSEEPGWRGYLQPRLRRRLAPLPATLVVGVVWAVWHLPLFAIPGTSQSSRDPVSALLAVLVFVPLASTFWAVSEGLRGGVVGAVLTHIAFNAASALYGTGTASATGIELAILVVVAVAVHIVARRRARSA